MPKDSREYVLALRVASASLRETGDGAGRLGDNTVNVALLWPRPGKADVLGSTGRVPLTDHPRDDDAPDTPALFDALVLKERVEGDVSLLVHVLERDRTGAFARLLRRIGSAALGGATGALGGGLVRHMFSEAISEGAIAVADLDDPRGEGARAGERIEVVAVGERPVLLDSARLESLAESGETARLLVPLVAPRELARAGEKGRLAPLRSNGSLELEVRVVRG